MKKKEKLNYCDVVKFIIIHQFNNSQGWGEVWTIDFLAEHLSHTPKQKEKIKELLERSEKVVVKWPECQAAIKKLYDEFFEPPVIATAKEA